MHCNLDAKGKALRLIAGMIVCLLGLAVLGLGWFEVIPWSAAAWWGGFAVAGGLFMVFEGWSGWCVVRAMGFKTPI